MSRSTRGDLASCDVTVPTAHLALRGGSYMRLCRELGLDNTADRARYFGLSRRHLHFIEAGESQPGGTFVAKVLARVGEDRFTEFFRVVAP